MERKVMEQVMEKIGLEEKPIKSGRSSNKNDLQTAQRDTMLNMLGQIHAQLYHISIL